MAKPFFQRLRKYYQDIAKVLRGEAEIASVFPNTTDIGMSREWAYAEFLRHHAPSKCNVFFGGFVFGDDGSESGQLDVIVTTDTTPQFNFHNRDGQGKSFSPVKGTLAVASIKTKLNKAELKDSLLGIAKIPPTQPLGKRVNPILKVDDYDDWPYKIIYASDGIALETIQTHIFNFYKQNHDIPITRRPNIIHVAGKYIIIRVKKGMSVFNINRGQREEIQPESGTYYPFVTDSDIQGIIWILDALQKRASASTHIIYNYSGIINKVNDISPAEAVQQPDSADGSKTV